MSKSNSPMNIDIQNERDSEPGLIYLDNVYRSDGSDDLEVETTTEDSFLSPRIDSFYRQEGWMSNRACLQCYNCDKKFNLWRRRHHCRACGQIFCNNCAPSHLYGFNQNCRLCDNCYNYLQEYSETNPDGFSSNYNTITSRHSSSSSSLSSSTKRKSTNSRGNAFTLFGSYNSSNSSNSTRKEESETNIRNNNSTSEMLKKPLLTPLTITLKEYDDYLIQDYDFAFPSDSEYQGINISSIFQQLFATSFSPIFNSTSNTSGITSPVPTTYISLNNINTNSMIQENSSNLPLHFGSPLRNSTINTPLNNISLSTSVNLPPNNLNTFSSVSNSASMSSPYLINSNESHRKRQHSVTKEMGSPNLIYDSRSGTTSMNYIDYPKDISSDKPRHSLNSPPQTRPRLFSSGHSSSISAPTNLIHMSSGDRSLMMHNSNHKDRSVPPETVDDPTGLINQNNPSQSPPFGFTMDPLVSSSRLLYLPSSQSPVLTPALIHSNSNSTASQGSHQSIMNMNQNFNTNTAIFGSLSPIPLVSATGNQTSNNTIISTSSMMRSSSNTSLNRSLLYSGSSSSTSTNNFLNSNINTNILSSYQRQYMSLVLEDKQLNYLYEQLSEIISHSSLLSPNKKEWLNTIYKLSCYTIQHILKEYKKSNRSNEYNGIGNMNQNGSYQLHPLRTHRHLSSFPASKSSNYRYNLSRNGSNPSRSRKMNLNEDGANISTGNLSSSHYEFSFDESPTPTGGLFPENNTTNNGSESNSKYTSPKRNLRLGSPHLHSRMSSQSHNTTQSFHSPGSSTPPYPSPQFPSLEDYEIPDTIYNNIYINIMEGSTIQNSMFIDGMLVNGIIANDITTFSIPNPRVVIFSGSIEFYKDPYPIVSFNTLLTQEDEYIHLLADKIFHLEPNVIIVEKFVCYKVLKLCEQRGIIVVSNCGYDTILRASELLKISIIKHIDTINLFDSEHYIGTCGLAISRQIQDIPVVYQTNYIYNGKTNRTYKSQIFLCLEECSQTNGCSIYLRGAGVPILNEAKLIIAYAIQTLISYKSEKQFYLAMNVAMVPREIPQEPSLSRKFTDYHHISTSPYILYGNLLPSLSSTPSHSIQYLAPLNYKTFNVAYVWMIKNRQCFSSRYASYPFTISDTTTLHYFIESILLNENNKCSSCNQPAMSHQIVYMQGNKFIHFSVETNKVRQTVPLSYRYSIYCHKCDNITFPELLLPIILNLSLAKFLELLFYDHTSYSYCGHSLFIDKTLLIYHDNYTIKIQIQPVTIFDLKACTVIPVKSGFIYRYILKLVTDLQFTMSKVVNYLLDFIQSALERLSSQSSPSMASLHDYKNTLVTNINGFIELLENGMYDSNITLFDVTILKKHLYTWIMKTIKILAGFIIPTDSALTNESTEAHESTLSAAQTHSFLNSSKEFSSLDLVHSTSSELIGDLPNSSISLDPTSSDLLNESTHDQNTSLFYDLSKIHDLSLDEALASLSGSLISQYLYSHLPKELFDGYPEAPTNSFNQSIPLYPSEPTSLYVYALLSDSYFSFIRSAISSTNQKFRNSEESENEDLQEHENPMNTLDAKPSHNPSFESTESLEESQSHLLDTSLLNDSLDNSNIHSQIQNEDLKVKNDPFASSFLNPFHSLGPNPRYNNYQFRDNVDDKINSYIHHSESLNKLSHKECESEDGESDESSESEEESPNPIPPSSSLPPSSNYQQSFPISPPSYDYSKIYFNSFTGCSSPNGDSYESKIYSTSHKHYLQKQLLSQYTNDFTYTLPIKIHDNVYQVKIFYPLQFYALRQSLGIIESDYITLLSRSFDIVTSGGKTGAYFCTSLDERYLCKCIKPREIATFNSQALSYFKYMDKILYQGYDSILVKTLGLFSIINEDEDEENTYSIMENLFYHHNLVVKYDLKGSDNEKKRLADKNASTLLDVNLLDNMKGLPYALRSSCLSYFLLSIFNDCGYLASNRIIDYSLLLGVDQENLELVIGIIDYYIDYDQKKKLEFAVKTMMGEEPTIVEPEVYRYRFMQNVYKYITALPDITFNVDSYKNLRNSFNI